MREKEIKEELELAIRSFIEAKERSVHKGIDDFDELRILEVSFNRLFICVEHLCNAIILMETGNFSKKHFGDFQKLKDLRDKYSLNLDEIYQTTYNFRSYADYRKFQQIKERFNKKELKEQIDIVENVIKNCLKIISNTINIELISKKIGLETRESKNTKTNGA